MPYKFEDYAEKLNELVPVEVRVKDYPFPLEMVGKYQEFLLNSEMAHKIYSEAYDRGHYAGEDEVLLFARSICEFLLTLPIKLTVSGDLVLIISDGQDELCLVKLEDYEKVTVGFHLLPDGDYLDLTSIRWST